MSIIYFDGKIWIHFCEGHEYHLSEILSIAIQWIKLL